MPLAMATASSSSSKGTTTTTGPKNSCCTAALSGLQPAMQRGRDVEAGVHVGALAAGDQLAALLDAGLDERLDAAALHRRR